MNNRKVLALAGAMMMTAFAAMPAAADCAVAWVANGPWNYTPPFNVLSYAGVGCPVARELALADCRARGFSGCRIEQSTGKRGMCMSASGGLLYNGQPVLYTNAVWPSDVALPDLRCVANSPVCSPRYVWACNR